jgi:hypothetical protein
MRFYLLNLSLFSRLRKKVMKYKIHSFRHADVILQQPEFINQYRELIDVIDSITDEDLILSHEEISNQSKSISNSINKLLKKKFQSLGWTIESGIFQDPDYQGDTWRLDFAKDDISIEVGFNHSSVIAWNLIKPVLASELNHVKKRIQTKIGVIITATSELQLKGGFDPAIGIFEKYLDYLPPLRNLLTTPLLIIGLEAPDTFEIEVIQFDTRKKVGRIVRK